MAGRLLQHCMCMTYVVQSSRMNIITLLALSGMACTNYSKCNLWFDSKFTFSYCDEWINAWVLLNFVVHMQTKCGFNWLIRWYVWNFFLNLNTAGRKRPIFQFQLFFAWLLSLHACTSKWLTCTLIVLPVLHAMIN